MQQNLAVNQPLQLHQVTRTWRDGDNPASLFHHSGQLFAFAGSVDADHRIHAALFKRQTVAGRHAKGHLRIAFGCGTDGGFRDIQPKGCGALFLGSIGKGGGVISFSTADIEDRCRPFRQ
ncbi:hypothetical protein D3C76_1399690 [compost metagenome]